MVLDNRDIILKINKLRYIFLLGYITILVILIFSNLFNDPVLGLKKSVYIVFSTSVYVIYNIVKYVLNYTFLSYSDEGNKLIFRFISLRPFDNKRNAIEILKKDFRRFKTSKSFFDLKEELILFVKTPKGVANYPSFSITALSLKQKSLLKNSLSQFVKP